MLSFQLIAASALYLAGKIKDDPVKIRDVINVTHNTLNRGTPPLELGDEYWSIRDAIVQAELLIARTLKFDLNIEHPHKVLLCTYMLPYLLNNPFITIFTTVFALLYENAAILVRSYYLVISTDSKISSFVSSRFSSQLKNPKPQTITRCNMLSVFSITIVWHSGPTC